MIQSGGAFDLIFKWQGMLARLYAKDKLWADLLQKALGGCEICTSFWMSPLWFIMYYLTVDGLGYWPIETWYIAIIWLFVYWVIGGSLSFFFIKKTWIDGV